MAKYLAKAIRSDVVLDVDGNKTGGEITGYEIKYSVSSQNIVTRPRGDYTFLEGVETRAPKAEFANGSWSVVEDTVKKGEKDLKKSELSAALKAIKSANTVAKLRDVVEKMARDIYGDRAVD